MTWFECPLYQEKFCYGTMHKRIVQSAALKLARLHKTIKVLVVLSSTYYGHASYYRYSVETIRLTVLMPLK